MLDGNIDDGSETATAWIRIGERSNVVDVDALAVGVEGSANVKPFGSTLRLCQVVAVVAGRRRVSG